MKIFLDTADIQKIKEFASTGLIDGITTNPSIIAKSGKDFKTVIAEICTLVSGPVSAEVISLETEGMLKEAEELIKIAKNVCIKLPITANGLKACKVLSDKGIMVNMTLCFSAAQGLMAAKAGATFVSPFIGRWDDIGINGMELISELRTIFNNYNFETQILAASARHPIHFLEAAQIGADVITISPDLFPKLISHPLTEKGIEIFLNDYNSSKK
jgi:transaldolase